MDRIKCKNDKVSDIGQGDYAPYRQVVVAWDVRAAGAATISNEAPHMTWWLVRVCAAYLHRATQGRLALNRRTSQYTVLRQCCTVQSRRVGLPLSLVAACQPAAATALRVLSICAKASYASGRKRDATNDLITRPHKNHTSSCSYTSGKVSASASVVCTLLVLFDSDAKLCFILGIARRSSMLLNLLVESTDQVADLFKCLEALPVADTLHNFQLLLACWHFLKHLLASLYRCSIVLRARNYQNRDVDLAVTRGFCVDDNSAVGTVASRILRQ